MKTLDLQWEKQVVASCNCLTKSPDMKYHSPHCYYRLLMESRHAPLKKRINLVAAQSLACKYRQQQRRARRLYVALCRRALNENHALIYKMAKRAIERGLWSPCDSSGRQTRQSIIKHLFNADEKRDYTITLGEWLQKNRWDMYKGAPLTDPQEVVVGCVGCNSSFFVMEGGVHIITCPKCETINHLLT